VPTIDGLLGATAIVHNLTVVTRNEIDLGATGAPIFNPWKI
jgi:predicted nucleic acid-binding protein